MHYKNWGRWFIFIVNVQWRSIQQKKKNTNFSYLKLMTKFQLESRDFFLLLFN